MIKQREINMTGKKDKPPKRGTGRVCTFRLSGSSNKRFLKDINKILGMTIIPRVTATIHPPNMK